MLFMNKRQRNIAMQIRQAKLENGKDKDKETNNNSSNSLSTETITM